jgi:hypothetical protein
VKGCLHVIGQPSPRAEPIAIGKAINTQRKKEWFDNEAFWRELYPYIFPEKRFVDVNINLFPSSRRFGKSTSEII